MPVRRCLYELIVALEVMQKYAKGDSFVVVEFSQRAWDVYRRRIVAWAEGEAVAAGLSNEQWKNRHELEPEYAYYRQAIKCEQATCYQPEDEAMIRGKVEAKAGGGERLNDRMARFRRPRASAVATS